MTNAQKTVHKREMPYDFKAQCENHKISQKEVYRETNLCIEKQNNMMQRGSLSSDYVAELNHTFDFDAPKDILDYDILRLVLTAQYNRMYLSDVAIGCNMTYPNIKRWEKAFYDEGKDRLLYEFKDDINAFKKSMKKKRKDFMYVKDVFPASKEEIAVGNEIDIRLLCVNLYLNRKTKKELLSAFSIEEPIFDFESVEALEGFDTFFEDWFNVTLE